MLDVQGYKSSPEDTKMFSALARDIFREETGQENLDALIGSDQYGNLWIYASEEAKIYAESQSNTPTTPASPPQLSGTPVKPLTQITWEAPQEGEISRAESEPAVLAAQKSNAEGYSYAKTLRLTSDQLVCPFLRD